MYLSFRFLHIPEIFESLGYYLQQFTQYRKADYCIAFSVIYYSQVTRDNFILKNGSIRYVDALPMIGNDNDGAFQNYVSPERDVSRNSQVVEFNDVGNGSEPGLKVLVFLEMLCAQLDQRRGAKHSLR